MDSFLDKFNKYQILRAAVYLLFGVIILIWPEPFFNILTYIVAVLFALAGIFNLFAVYRERKDYGQLLPGQIIIGITALIAALLVLVFAKTIVSIIPFFLGLFVMLNGIRQLMQELRLGKGGLSSPGWLIFSTLMIIVGAVLTFNPFKSVLVVFQIFAVVLIILGISEIAGFFLRGSRKTDATPDETVPDFDTKPRAQPKEAEIIPDESSSDTNDSESFDKGEKP